MKYQLVLQFDEHIFPFEEMISFENKLENSLRGFADVDGHDYGSGEINFFIFTDHPQETFDIIQTEFINTNLKNHLRAGFRHVEKETFSVLWPQDLPEFEVA